MWENAQTKENLSALEARGVKVVEPGSGFLACGTTGKGRVADLQQIFDAAKEAVCSKN